MGRALWRELVVGFAWQLGELRLGFTQLAALYVLADWAPLPWPTWPMRSADRHPRPHGSSTGSSGAGSSSAARRRRIGASARSG